jgi:hypothetical protein
LGGITASGRQGTPFARLKRTTFIRGGGGFGGAAEAANPARVHAAPEGAPDHVIDLATRPAQGLFYRLNGELTPPHGDPDLAWQVGFDLPILHGVIAAARAQLAAYKVPLRAWPIQAYPTTDSANGLKIQRSRLREMAEERIGETTA